VERLLYIPAFRSLVATITGTIWQIRRLASRQA
jgi:hypothetical protein